MQVIEETIQLLKQYSIKNCVLYNTDGKNIPNEAFDKLCVRTVSIIKPGTINEE